MSIKKFMHSIGIILLYIILSLLISGINLVYKVNNNPICDILEQILIWIIIIYVVKPDYKNDIKKFKTKYREYIKTMIIWWIISMIFLLVTNMLVVSLLGIAPNEQENRKVLLENPISSIITLGLLGPCIEELVFRESFKDSIKNKYAYAIITGLIFGSMHVIFSISKISDLLYIIPYSSLGIGLGVIYKKTDDNVVATTLTHMFHNLLSVFLILFSI